MRLVHDTPIRGVWGRNKLPEIAGFLKKCLFLCKIDRFELPEITGKKTIKCFVD